MVAVANERWSLIRRSKYSDLTWKLFWYFGKLVAEERKSLAIGGFDCIFRVPKTLCLNSVCVGSDVKKVLLNLVTFV